MHVRKSAASKACMSARVPAADFALLAADMLTSAASVGGDGSVGRSEIRLMAALKKESACEYITHVSS